MRGIVLKISPAREHDLYVVCYTQESGKHTYQARGALRSYSLQSRHLDVMNEVSFTTVETKSMPLMASAHCLRSFRRIKSSLPALATAYFFIELFDRLVYDNDSDGRLWRFLTETLAEIDQNTQDNTSWRSMLHGRYRTMMSVMGYSGDTDAQELSHSEFSSLVFFDAIVPRGHKT